MDQDLAMGEVWVEGQQLRLKAPQLSELHSQLAGLGGGTHRFLEV